MARPIERIEQDLAALEEAVAQLRVEFHTAYSQYLKLLGQIMQRQLIQASYQICTQGYPEAFLNLPFSHRQKLQQSIRQLGKQAQEQLLSYLALSKDTTEQTPEQFPIESEQSQDETPEQLAEPLEFSESLEAKETAEITKKEPTPLEQLVQWQEQLEKAIAKTMQSISLETNRLLQQTEILPNKLPAAVLEAAAKVDSSTESTTVGSPNLLNLLMETESDDSEDSTLTRIVAVNLRLSEIEFTDPTLSAGRNQIRNLSAKGNMLQRQSLKLQREHSVAQAEAAWRASWFED
ncbi:MAG TPA: hypothetical protein V6C91_02435 [Coleofasciculaceae cyanobacterium]